MNIYDLPRNIIVIQGKGFPPIFPPILLSNLFPYLSAYLFWDSVQKSQFASAWGSLILLAFFAGVEVQSKPRLLPDPEGGEVAMLYLRARNKWNESSCKFALYGAFFLLSKRR